MLVLFETPAGYALFKALDKGIFSKDPEEIASAFSTAEGAQSQLKLAAFSKFQDVESAVAAAEAICAGKLDKTLKKFLKSSIVEKAVKGKLAVVDKTLGGLIKDKLGIKCVSDDAVLECMRGIRGQLSALISAISPADLQAMKLGLSHSLSRFKLKFSPDKVDTMIVQAIALLDDLDKELNTYAMRVREWYGWHFPEMAKIVVDNIQYAKVVQKMGVRTNCSSTDLSDILSEEVEPLVKEAAEVSMGTEVSDEDIFNIQALATQVVSLAVYRAQLFDYLKNRMNAIAPNLTVMVGELVGARLIAHAGSLLNLAKQPASTVQIIGAEKALFRALKTKHDTPKYGLIYHASLVGQAAPKLKGKISRVLAAKTALSIREDALGETDGVTIGFASREKVERRLAQLEGGNVSALSGTGRSKPQQEKYQKPTSVTSYSSASDTPGAPVVGSKRAREEDDEETEKEKKKKAKKAKKAAKKEAEAAAAAAAEAEAPKKKKKKKSKKQEE